MHNLTQKPLHKLLTLIEHKELRVESVIEAYYQRIQQREDEVNAWQYLRSYDDYLAHYLTHKTYYEQSILKGLPFGVKDVIDTMDMPTTLGADIYQNRQPLQDAVSVNLLKHYGGIVMGKTVTTSFAFFNPGVTRNPKKLDCTPGGSSSGSAAAVSDGMIPFALGTQTAASVIRPASYCGCIGYVGTHGEFSMRNIQPLAQSLDSLGILTQSVEDVMLIRDLLLMRPKTELQPIDLSELNIGICDGEMLGEIDLAMQRVFLTWIESLRSQGINCVHLPNELDIKTIAEQHYFIMAFEVARNLSIEYFNGEIDALLADLIETGLTFSYKEYCTMKQDLCEQKEALKQWRGQNNITAITAPSAPGVAPTGIQHTGKPFMSRPWQALGFPVITLPIAEDQLLPLGVQLIGLEGDDRLLNLAYSLFDKKKEI